MSASLLQRAVQAVGADELYKMLSKEQRNKLPYLWRAIARPEQILPEGNWMIAGLLGGRGSGKTRPGAEWVREEAESGRRGRFALVAPTAADARDVMVEGESGIMAISPPWFYPKYEPSKRRIVWPNGAMATLFSGDEPDRLRGPQHDGAWVDELAAFRYPEEAWDMLMLGLRIRREGVEPRVVFSTTPRPIPIIRKLVAQAKEPNARVVLRKYSTFDNAPNLAPGFLAEMRARYENTRLGRQELFAEILEDAEGALWSRDLIEHHRVTRAPEMIRKVVAIDPAVTNEVDSDETGIIVAGLGIDGHCYILADLSGRYSPAKWARLAVEAYHNFGCDRIIAETNNGGSLVEANLRTVDKNVPYRAVRASEGKRTRAEPIAALDEQGRVHHVGMFAILEDQMCTWEALKGDKSPDRVDARVWALTELMLTKRQASYDDDSGYGKRRI
jgi:phage terminase large subunit-like protein